MYRLLLSIGVTLVLSNAVFGDWSTPVQVSGLNSAYIESASYISEDGLTAYINRGSTPDHYVFQIYKGTRTSINDPFTVSRVSELSSYLHTTYAWQSTDGLRLYYNSDWSFKMSTRQSVNATWSSGSYITSLNNIGRVETLKLSSDELTAIFDSPDGPNVKGGYDMYIATRTDKNAPFANIRLLTELNTSAHDNGASITGDGLTIFFQSTRSGQMFCYKATRNSLADAFGTPEQLPFAAGFGIPTISADGKTLLLAYNNDIYISSIPEPATMMLLGLGALCLRKK